MQLQYQNAAGKLGPQRNVPYWNSGRDLADFSSYLKFSLCEAATDYEIVVKI
jgi:hypothetical protein